MDQKAADAYEEPTVSISNAADSSAGNFRQAGAYMDDNNSNQVLKPKYSGRKNKTYLHKMSERAGKTSPNARLYNSHLSKLDKQAEELGLYKDEAGRYSTSKASGSDQKISTQLQSVTVGLKQIPQKRQNNSTD